MRAQAQPPHRGLARLDPWLAAFGLALAVFSGSLFFGTIVVLRSEGATAGVPDAVAATPLRGLNDTTRTVTVPGGANSAPGSESNPGPGLLTPTQAPELSGDAQLDAA
ncbi:MAG: hypothetical protein ABI305_08625, partial [Tepidiformaceae bacterium]